MNEVPPFDQVNISFELEKLKIELRHIQGMYALAQSETMDASRKVTFVFLAFGKVSELHISIQCFSMTFR